MKYSFLVPVYNSQKTLGICLESLINQKFKGEYEVIVYNDCSNDGSRDVCLTFVQKYPNIVRLIEGTVNIGLYEGRIELFKNSTGDVVLFVDSDDYVSDNLLNVIDAVFDKIPDVDVVIYDFVATYNIANFFEFKKKIKNLDLPEEIVLSKYEILEEISKGNLNAVWRKAFRRTIFDVNEISNHSKKLSVAEDLVFSTYMISKATNIVYLNKYLYFYVHPPKSMTHSSWNIEKIDSFCYALSYASSYIMQTNDQKIKESYRNYVFSALQSMILGVLCTKEAGEKRKLLLRIVEDEYVHRYLINEGDDVSKCLILKDWNKLEKIYKKKVHLKRLKGNIRRMILR